MGYIIVIEGTDGSGKKTQTEKLVDRLINDGYQVKRQSFPNYDSPSASPVKMYLGGEFGSSDMSMDAYQASVLYAVDRLCTYKKELEEFYLGGGIIVFDRYVESNMLHQAGKIENRVDVDKYLDWLDELEFNTLKLPRPNRVIFLDVPVEISDALARSRESYKSNTSKDIHEQNPEHLKKAYKSGKYVSEKYNWSQIDCTRDGAMKSIEEISDEIFEIVKNDMENMES